MRPERGLVARAALEAPDGSLVVRRLARRVAPPRTREDPRPCGIDRREVAPELEDDLEDPERDDEEHELVELEGPDDEHIKAPAHAQQARREVNTDEHQREPVRAPPARNRPHDTNQAQRLLEEQGVEGDEERVEEREALDRVRRRQDDFFKLG